MAGAILKAIVLFAAACLTPGESQGIELVSGLESSAPCAGLFSKSGFQGCTSKSDSQRNVGELRYFDTQISFDAARSSGSFRGAWVISNEIWCSMNRASLESLNALASSLFVIQQLPQPAPCMRPSGFNSNWNSNGAATTESALSFPVTKLSVADSLSLLSQINATGTRKARFDFYMGRSDGSVTSATCLDLKRCTPLGGQSVWGTVRSPPLGESESVLMLTANMDSTSFFRDFAFGFHASGGDISIVLAATAALAELPLTTTRIVSAIFQGESYGRIGSRRFVADIIDGKCRQFSRVTNRSCADPPNFSLEFTKFNSDITRIQGIISLSNVLRMDLNANSTSLFVPLSNSSLSATIASRFSQELVELGAQMPSISARNLDQVGPTALASFVENANWTSSEVTGGLVIAGYANDISEANPRYETEEDVMDSSNFAAYLARAETLATAVARAMFFVASNGTSTNVTVDRELLSALLTCFGTSFADKCSLAASALNVTSSQLKSLVANSAPSASRPFKDAANKPLTSYTSVYIPLAPESGRDRLRERFIRNVLANLTIGRTLPAPLTATPFQGCTSDALCRDNWDGIVSCPGSLPTNASVACVGGRCVCTTVFYHDSWSTSLNLNPFTGVFTLASSVSASDPLFTEPTWEDGSPVTFSASSTADIVASLIVGIGLTLGSLLLVKRAKRRQDTSGKFKLA